jgi:hypothetical protein
MNASCADEHIRDGPQPEEEDRDSVCVAPAAREEQGHLRPVVVPERRRVQEEQLFVEAHVRSASAPIRFHVRD